MRQQRAALWRQTPAAPRFRQTRLRWRPNLSRLSTVTHHLDHAADSRRQFSRRFGNQRPPRMAIYLSAGGVAQGETYGWLDDQTVAFTVPPDDQNPCLTYGVNRTFVEPVRAVMNAERLRPAFTGTQPFLFYTLSCCPGTFAPFYFCLPCSSSTRALIVSS